MLKCSVLKLFFGGSLVFLSAVSVASPCPPVPDTGPRALAQLAETPQPDRGFLWKLSKNGRDHYLFASIHVAKQEWGILGPRTSQAFAQATRLAVELDLTKRAMPLQGVAPVRRTTFVPKTHAEALLQQRVNQQYSLRCLEPTRFGSTPPQQLLEIGLRSAVEDGLWPNFAIDGPVAELARAQNKPVVELETLAEQKRVLYVKKSKQAAEKEIQDYLVSVEDGSQRRNLKNMAEAWERSDWHFFEDYLTSCDCYNSKEKQEAFNHLVFERNVSLADRINRFIGNTPTGSGFVTIGVLHMIGSKSVLKQLESKGFMIERVFPSEE